MQSTMQRFCPPDFKRKSHVAWATPERNNNKKLLKTYILVYFSSFITRTLFYYCYLWCWGSFFAITHCIKVERWWNKKTLGRIERNDIRAFLEIKFADFFLVEFEAGICIFLHAAPLALNLPTFPRRNVEFARLLPDFNVANSFISLGPLSIG